MNVFIAVKGTHFMIFIRCFYQSTEPIIGIRDPSSLFLKAFVWDNAYTVDFIETFKCMN